MAQFKFKEYIPNIGSNVYIAEDAAVIGRCEIKDQVSIWFNSVVRGDVNQITIGYKTNIQDLSMLHVTEENDLMIGNETSVGHSVTLHGCHIGDRCLIGMGATVLDKAIINDESIVAAGSLVPPGKEYPKHSMIMGNPAKVVRKLTEAEITFISNHHKSYLGYAREFNEHLERIN